MSEAPLIVLEGIELRGRCGVSVAERAVGQLLIVDLRLQAAVCEGCHSDELVDTVDYAHLVDVVRAIVAGNEFRLLERLASVIADTLWAEGGLRFVTVSVTKPSPPVSIPVRLARVEVTRER